MFDRSLLLSEVDDFGHVLDIDNLDRQLTTLCQSPAYLNLCAENILAGHCYPISVWCQGEISDG